MKRWERAARRFRCVVGMDTGAWLMAHAGLLENGAATIHWDELTAFAETFDDIDTVSDRYVMNGNRLTCGGAMTAFDLVLELIRRTHGEALGLEVSAFFLHQSAEPPGERMFKRHASPMVERCLAIMSGSLEAPLTITELAQMVQTNQRTLGRVFQAELGASPKRVYKWLRLAAARRYAQTSSYPIAEIALRCGYANAAAMTRAFVERYGKPPSAFRQMS